MDNVRGVNMQVLKEVEFPKEEVKFGGKHDNKESNDKGMRKSTKWMIGATILAATTAIGIITHKKIKAGKAAEELLGKIKHEKGYITRLFNGTGCEETVAARLAEIEKLSPEEQLQALQNLGEIHQNIRGMRYYVKNNVQGAYLRRGMTEYPEEVKKAIAEGRWLDAGELYEKYVQTLPNTYRVKTTGKTVDETIANVFGKDCKIKPHTYDLSKEGEYVMTQRNFGGFAESIATKDGVIYEDYSKLPETLRKSFINSNGFMPKCDVTKINEEYIIFHGVQDGKYVTILKGPAPGEFDEAGGKIPMTIGLISKERRMSPAQKDLLSLAEHPENFNASYIDKLTKREHVRNDVGDAGLVNLDYDLAYSIIQAMAKGL